MSKNRYINTYFWEDPYIMGLDPSEKLLFLYLLTNPLTNIAGVYEIPISRISFDTGFDKDMVDNIIRRFESDDKAMYWDGWIAMKNWRRHQSGGSKVEAGIQRCLKDAPVDLIPYAYPMYEVSIGYEKSGIVKSSIVSYSENVEMTEKEYGKLVESYGEKGARAAITKLDAYKGSSGKTYKSDYRAILSWVVEALDLKPPKPRCPKCNKLLPDVGTLCVQCGWIKEEG